MIRGCVEWRDVGKSVGAAVDDVGGLSAWGARKCELVDIVSKESVLPSLHPSVFPSVPPSVSSSVSPHAETLARRKTEKIERSVCLVMV